MLVTHPISRAISHPSHRPNGWYGNTSRVLLNSTLDYNVYSCADGTTCPHDFLGGAVEGRSLAAWQAWGRKDAHSVAGDAGFATDFTALAVRRDFRVDPARSAALRAIGFVPLNLDAVGPRADALSLAVCANNGGDSGVWWRGCSFGIV